MPTNASLTLPTPGTVGSLGANKNIIINTTTPPGNIGTREAAIWPGDASVPHNICFSSLCPFDDASSGVLGPGSESQNIYLSRGISSINRGITVYNKWPAQSPPASGAYDATNQYIPPSDDENHVNIVQIGTGGHLGTVGEDHYGPEANGSGDAYPAAWRVGPKVNGNVNLKGPMVYTGTGASRWSRFYGAFRRGDIERISAGLNPEVVIDGSPQRNYICHALNIFINGGVFFNKNSTPPWVWPSNGRDANFANDYGTTGKWFVGDRCGIPWNTPLPNPLPAALALGTPGRALWNTGKLFGWWVSNFAGTTTMLAEAEATVMEPWLTTLRNGNAFNLYIVGQIRRCKRADNPMQDANGISQAQPGGAGTPRLTNYLPPFAY